MCFDTHHNPMILGINENRYFQSCHTSSNNTRAGFDSAPLLTGFLLWRQYWRHFWGSFFTGAYLPQKSVLSPPLESQYKPFQKHVSSYLVERSPGCVVWAAPTALRDGPYLIMEEQHFSTLIRGAELNPARVLSREVCHN
jgi:hypothetical protein